MSETLAERLPKEMARVRKLLPLYDEVPFGFFAAAVMRQELERAEKALADGDIGEMVCACINLMDHKA
jgi:hypothetical protein